MGQRHYNRGYLTAFRFVFCQATRYLGTTQQCFNYPYLVLISQWPWVFAFYRHVSNAERRGFVGAVTNIIESLEVLHGPL